MDPGDALIGRIPSSEESVKSLGKRICAVGHPEQVLEYDACQIESLFVDPLLDLEPLFCVEEA